MPSEDGAEGAWPCWDGGLGTTLPPLSLLKPNSAWKVVLSATFCLSPTLARDRGVSCAYFPALEFALSLKVEWGPRRAGLWPRTVLAAVVRCHLLATAHILTSYSGSRCWSSSSKNKRN